MVIDRRLLSRQQFWIRDERVREKYLDRPSQQMEIDRVQREGELTGSMPNVRTEQQRKC